MYLFLAVPNFCGSTLIHSLLETVPCITPLTIQKQYGKSDFVEGNVCARRGYKGVNLSPHSIEANMLHVFTDPARYDWNVVKMMWEENWFETNPYATIQMQKTPSDVLRIPLMQPHFNAHWILSVRNPYAYVESIMRKAPYGLDPIRQLGEICFHVLKVMELQIENRKYLGDKAYVMTYEDFIARPEWHRNEMAKWIPELKDIDFQSQELMVKGSKVVEIKDDSNRRIQNLIDKVPNIIASINEFFAPQEHLLNYWGYELIEENSHHGFASSRQNLLSQSAQDLH